MNEFEAQTNSVNGPIIFAYYGESELARLTGHYGGGTYDPTGMDIFATRDKKKYMRSQECRSFSGKPFCNTSSSENRNLSHSP